MTAGDLAWLSPQDPATEGGRAVPPVIPQGHWKGGLEALPDHHRYTTGIAFATGHRGGGLEARPGDVVKFESTWR